MGTKVRTGVELARVGEWETSTGTWNCTRQQIRDAVRAAGSGKFRTPIVKAGHRDPRFDGEPALGSIRNLRASDDGDALIGDLVLPSWLDESLPSMYPNRSIESLLGVDTADGDHYAMVATGLALLGVTPPAIATLADLETAVGEVEELPEFVAAMAVAASAGDQMDDIDPDLVEAAWNETLHPRAGGKFAAKGSGYQKAPSGAGAQRGGETQTANPADVKALQQRLMRLGYLPRDAGKNGHAIDGLFGPKTEAALKAYQKDHGLNPTGHISVSAIGGMAKPSGNLHPKKGASKPAAKKAAPRPVKRAMPAKPGRRVTASGDSACTCTDSSCPSCRTLIDATPVLLASARGRGSDTDSQERRMDLAGLREQLGLADDVDDDAVIAAAVERIEQADEPAPPVVTEPEPAGDLIAASGPELDALVDARAKAIVAAAQKPILDQLRAVSGELAERKKTEQVAEKARLIEAALADGKITPAQREMWEAQHDAGTDIGVIFASLAPGSAIPVAAAGRTGSAETTEDAVDTAFWDQIQPGVTH